MSFLQKTALTLSFALASLSSMAQADNAPLPARFVRMTDRCAGLSLVPSRKDILLDARHVPVLGNFAVISLSDGLEATLCVTPQDLETMIQNEKTALSEKTDYEKFREKSARTGYARNVEAAFKRLPPEQQTEENHDKLKQRAADLVKQVEDGIAREKEESRPYLQSRVTAMETSLSAMQAYEKNTGKPSGPGHQPFQLPDLGDAEFAGLATTCKGPAYIGTEKYPSPLLEQDLPTMKGPFATFTVPGKAQPVTFCIPADAFREAVQFHEDNQEGFARRDHDTLELDFARRRFTEYAASNPETLSEDQLRKMTVDAQARLTRELAAFDQSKEVEYKTYRKALNALGL